MIITHAISGPAGTAILLLAALGLLVGIVVWAVRARTRSTRNLAYPTPCRCGGTSSPLRAPRPASTAHRPMGD